MSDGEVERIVRASETIARDVAELKVLVFHLSKVSEQHDKNIDDLYDKTNGMASDLAGFKGKIAGIGVLAGLLGSGIVSWLSRQFGVGQ